MIAQIIKYGKWLIFMVACFILMAFLYLFAVPHSIIAQRSGLHDAYYNQHFADYYTVFKTSDGEDLAGWLFERNSGSELIVCFPGNTCNAGMYAEMASQDLGKSYLMLNYRGYGSSSGKLNEKNMVQDACEAISFYSQKLKPKRITLLGFSLGTGVAIQVAYNCSQVSRLILVCPFDSMINIACGDAFNLNKYWLRDHFDSMKYAPALKNEIFVIYSQDDRIVRPEQTKRLLSAFTSEVQVHIVRGTHQDVISSPEGRRVISNIIDK